MRILMITAKDYDDSEVLYPYLRLLEADYEVDVASFTKGAVNGKYHYVIDANKELGEVNPQEYDGLILPGGKAPEKIRLNEDALKIIQCFMAKNLPIAAICHGQQLLISAGVLAGRRATCYPGIRDDLKYAGAAYEDARVVTDGNLVTSRRPEDLPYFMKAFLNVLNKR